MEYSATVRLNWRKTIQCLQSRHFGVSDVIKCVPTAPLYYFSSPRQRLPSDPFWYWARDFLFRKVWTYVYSLFSLPQLFSFYLIAKFTIFFSQNIQIAFQDISFSQDTPSWLTWYFRERVATTVHCIRESVQRSFGASFLLDVVRVMWVQISDKVSWD